ncbi:MAG: T9SS type A sorting domain-containing protein [Bacteroidetes bacterium]|nr:T9SS type A sorting domain-containing protein [Bacteroidota bacterium]
MKTKVLLLTFLMCIVTSESIRAQFNFQQYATPPGINVGTSWMSDISIDAFNNKWVSFGTDGVGVFDNTSWVFYNSGNSPLPSDSTTCTRFDLAGNVWIGTSNGLAFKSGTNWAIYSTVNSGLPNNVITTINATNSTIWIGTLGGLVSFDGTTWTQFNTTNSGLPNDSVTCLEWDNNGKLWIGTRNGLASFDGSIWNVFTEANSDLSRYIIDLELDIHDRLWISCGIKTGIQINTSGVYYVESSILKSFLNDFYNRDLVLQFPKQLIFGKTTAGELLIRANSFSASLFIKCLSSGISFYEIPALNNATINFGINLVVDQSDQLWWLNKYRFYLYSIDLTSYVSHLNDDITPENFRKLNINDVSAGIMVSGDMHWDGYNSHYTVPKDDGKNSVFASALWIGGIDAGGQLHASVQTYRQTNTDYWPGPIDGLSTPIDSSTSLDFNRIWKIDKWKIEEFKYNFLAGNVSNGSYIIPEEFVTWPAKGNGIVTDNLAPFVDYNNDGIYNNMDGDFPLIKGDQFLYRIFNDSLAGSSAASSDGLRLGVEVHASAYAFNCSTISDSNIVLNRTTFYNYTIINRSTNDYDSVYVGLWCDVDLGNSQDDYVGCDTLLAAGFVYNGDNNDETSLGYGLNPPMQNIKVLKGMIADPMDGIDNDLDGTIDEAGERSTMNHFMYYDNVNNSPTGYPDSIGEYYNYLRSIWLDGIPVRYGGNGRNTSGPPTNFMYSGEPYNSSGWTEITAGNTPEDRRMVLSSGPVSLDAADTISLDFAYVFSWDSINPNGLTTSIARNRADLMRVQQWFDQQNFPSCEVYTVGLAESEMKQPVYSLFPNPASNTIYINCSNEKNTNLTYKIMNVIGEQLLHGSGTISEIDISALSSQVLFIQIESDQLREVHKIVKY